MINKEMVVINMKKKIMQQIVTTLLILLCSMVSIRVYAGVALGATRIIYPEGQKQVQIAVTNNDDKGVFLIQSWIENSNLKKDSQFTITPPLFSMQGKKENTLRIIDATNNTLPKDRESLFWLNVKAIPAMDKEKSNDNALQLAIISRIKLYYRPNDLPIPPEQVVDDLTFKKQLNTIIIKNPTPYYATVVSLYLGKTKLDNTLVPPFGESKVDVPNGTVGELTFQTINDYGALTRPKNVTLQD